MKILNFGWVLFGFVCAVIFADSLSAQMMSMTPNELHFNGLTAREGTGSFALTIIVSAAKGARGEIDESDSYDGGRNKGPQFDSVDLYNFVRVSPATKFMISSKPSGFVLVGDFKADTNYKVTLTAGLSSIEGVRLASEQSRDVRTGSFKPRFSFKQKARYLPQSFQGSLSWEAINIDKIEFSIRQVYPQNLHQWLTLGESTSSYVSEEIKISFGNTKATSNTIKNGSLSLADLDPIGQGVFVIEARTPRVAAIPTPVPQVANGPDYDEMGEEGGEGEDGGGVEVGVPQQIVTVYDTATVVVTNLAVMAKIGRDQLTVWVASTKDLKPIRDAQVELFAMSNKKLGSCRTSGGNAECSITWKSSEKSSERNSEKFSEPVRPYAMIIRSGSDLTYVRVEDVSLPRDRLHAGKREYISGVGGFDAYIFAERELYRPGENIQLAAMLRNQKYEVVPKLPLRWTITDPRGKIVREVVTSTSEMGLAQLNYLTNAASDTGKYTVTIANGGKILHEIGVMVEEFVPERIGVKVAPSKPLFVGGAKVDFGLSAQYLFGPPVAGGTYQIQCSMKPAWRTIPNRADYSTGLYSADVKPAVLFEASSGSFDAKGLAQGVCEGASGKLSEAYEIRAKVDVAEAGSGRVSSKTGTAYIASSDTLIGLKLESGSKGRTFVVRGGLFDLKGELKKVGSKVKLQILNVKQNWYYTYGGGAAEWKADEMISPTGVERTVQVIDGKFEASLDAPEGWGRWLIRAVDIQTGMTADLDAGYIGWYGNMTARGDKGGLRAPEPEQLKIELSKTEVSPGDKVDVLVVAPYTGKLLISFETDRVLETKWITVDKPGQITTELKVPDVLPNVYVTALLLKNPSAEGRFIPGRAWGGTSLRLIPLQHRLTVQTKHSELSESRKAVTIQLSNAEKVAATYSLAVVDEGILQMTDYLSPDPMRRFFEPRALGVVSIETLGWTVAQADHPKNPGGDEGKDKRSQAMPVKLVSFWFPAIQSDSSGKAEVKINLPSFQGKVRVMAVAGAKTRMGSSSTTMTVRDPLVLQPTLPRFMTQGDHFQFPVTITNLSGKDQNVKIQVESSPLVAVTAPAKVMAVPNGQQRTALFDADVKGVLGTARIKIQADAVEAKLSSMETFELPVKPAGVEQTLRLAFDINQEVNLQAELPSDWRPDFIRIEASVSSLPYLNQLGHLSALIHYPYGCIEQTTSSTMPLLAIGELLNFVEAKPKNMANLTDMVNRGIHRVLSMQTASGGFGYWPGDNSPDPWGTAYATHMLLDAKKLGYNVSETGLTSALSYLETFVRNNSYTTASTYSLARAEPFALYVLAKAGRSVTQELRESARNARPTNTQQVGYKWDGLTAENVFLLSAAAKLMGDSETMKILAAESLYSIQLVGDRDQEYSYWSPLRSDGLRLSVLEDLWPQHAASEILAGRLAAALAQKKGQIYYYSSQDLGWAILGLGKRIKGFKPPDPAAYAKTSLNVNGKPVSKSFDVGGLPGFVIEGGGLQASRLRIGGAPSAKGQYLYVKAKGFSKTPPPSPSPLKISRQFLRPNGTVADLQSIRQGETLVVSLEISNSSHSKVPNIAVVDRVPAGFEIENPRLGRTQEAEWMKEPFKAEYQDLRDDRIQVFGDLNRGQTQTIYYAVRAVTKGRYTAPASFVEAMYDPAMFDYDQDAAIQIIGPTLGK